MHVGIVGAGPAGVSAAVFLKRCGIEISVFEKESVGGLIANAWRVENVPIISPCSGEEIARSLKMSLNEFSINVLYEEVVEVFNRRVLTRSKEYLFDKIIVASGTLPRRILRFEVSSNVVYEYRHLPADIESLAVFGAGDAALDGALKAFENGVRSVHIFSRSGKIKAIKRLRDLAMNSPIVFHFSEPILDVIQGEKLILTTHKAVYEFDALLICIGRVPNVLFVKERTSDIYVVGDAHGSHRQMSIAIGQAIETAMNILGG